MLEKPANDRGFIQYGDDNGDTHSHSDYDFSRTNAAFARAISSTELMHEKIWQANCVRAGAYRFFSRRRGVPGAWLDSSIGELGGATWSGGRGCFHRRLRDRDRLVISWLDFHGGGGTYLRCPRRNRSGVVRRDAWRGISVSRCALPCPRQRSKIREIKSSISGHRPGDRREWLEDRRLAPFKSAHSVQHQQLFLRHHCDSVLAVCAGIGDRDAAGRAPLCLSRCCWKGDSRR